MISEIATPDLVTETEARETRIEVRLVGDADTRIRSDLTTFLDGLHRAALDSNAGEVVVDMRAVEFISAACLRALVGWLGKLQARPRYLACFVWDRRKYWQRRSFESLAQFGGSLVRIDRS